MTHVYGWIYHWWIARICRLFLRGKGEGEMIFFVALAVLMILIVCVMPDKK